MKKSIRIFKFIFVLVLGVTTVACSDEIKAKDFSNKESCVMKFESTKAAAILDATIKIKDNKVQKEYITGKGYTIEVYEITKDAITLKHISYPDSKEVNSLRGKEHFDREENSNEVILQGPIKEGTKFGNFEIVKVDADPKLDVDLGDGICILVKNKRIEDNISYEDNYYFKEGYGIVKTESYTDGILTEELVLRRYEK